MNNDLNSNSLPGRISALLKNARNKVIITVDQTMVLTYFEIGRMIVEEEQDGKQVLNSPSSSNGLQRAIAWPGTLRQSLFCRIRIFQLHELFLIYAS